jgi:N-methylhydantoinase B
MTNSWNTPTEVFEESYPVRVRRYAIRRNSGGEGAHRGGEGVIREIEFLTQVVAGLLTDRRTTAPYGLRGGQAGKPGRNTLIRKRKINPLLAKCSFTAAPGDILRIETPGGGGWGNPRRNPKR